jgi:hypothetical protein
MGVVVLPGQAQLDTTARIAGTVRSSINGSPIFGVRIAVRGSRVSGVSDSGGTFALEGLAPGHQTVRILYRDSLEYDQDVRLRAGKTAILSVLLDLDEVALAPIVVEASSLGRDRSLAGFFERRKAGFGRFYTLADLDRLHDLSPAALLRQAGLIVRCRLRACVPLVYTAGAPCVVTLFLDGMKISPDYLEDLHVDELAGVEVYTRALDVPREYRWWFGGDCGAVLLWGRY